MVRIPRIAVLAVVVLSVGFAGRGAQGQEAELTTSEGSQVVVDPAMFERLRGSSGVITGLRIRAGGTREPFQIATAVRPRGGDLTVDGMNVSADRYSLDLATRVIEAEGNVTVTTTREDGLNVTIRANRMTIEESQ
jgi:hypothetical protein